MTKSDIIEQIKLKKSLLCIGLDTDLTLIPKFLLDFPDPVFEFNKRIIDATHDLCVAYKPNFAFYEAQGSKGWDSLKKTIDYIPKSILSIADAKRGDIGNTSDQYAKAIFQELGFDSITLSPYMGKDSILPYLSYPNKWAIVLAFTSNPSNYDVQLLKTENNRYLFEEIIHQTQQYSTSENMMYVVGATSNSQHLKHIRNLAPDHFFLIPGIGAQGGDLKEVITQTLTQEYGILINASRSIIYASNGVNFEQHARESALDIVQQMQSHINF